MKYKFQINILTQIRLHITGQDGRTVADPAFYMTEDQGRIHVVKQHCTNHIDPIIPPFFQQERPSLTMCESNNS